MLEDDKFLKGSGSEELFTNPTLHTVLAQLSMINQAVPAPKMAFVVMKIMEGLQHSDGFERGRGTQKDESEGEKVYPNVLRLVLQHAGTQHWVAHRGTLRGKAPAQSYILIAKNEEARSETFIACENPVISISLPLDYFLCRRQTTQRNRV